MSIKNIVFDLGGVILELNYQLTQNAFAELGAEKFSDFYSQQAQAKLFDCLETGKISTADFRMAAKTSLGITRVSDRAFDHAWNAMLVTFVTAKLNYLEELGRNYSLYLFSNINSIHYDFIAKMYQEVTGKGFEHFNQLFKTSYYSHLFGMRKPHKESFERILAINGLNASETLFVDDSAQHLVGAEAAGLHTHLITKSSDIFQTGSQIKALEEQLLSRLQ